MPGLGCHRTLLIPKGLCDAICERCNAVVPCLGTYRFGSGTAGDAIERSLITSCIFRPGWDRSFFVKTLRQLEITSALHHHQAKILVHISPESDILTDPLFGGLDHPSVAIKLAAGFLE